MSTPTMPPFPRSATPTSPRQPSALHRNSSTAMSATRPFPGLGACQEPPRLPWCAIHSFLNPLIILPLLLTAFPVLFLNTLPLPPHRQSTAAFSTVFTLRWTNIVCRMFRRQGLLFRTSPPAGTADLHHLSNRPTPPSCPHPLRNDTSPECPLSLNRHPPATFPSTSTPMLNMPFWSACTRSTMTASSISSLPPLLPARRVP